jgi:hypothetical protein
VMPSRIFFPLSVVAAVIGSATCPVKGVMILRESSEHGDFGLAA